MSPKAIGLLAVPQLALSWRPTIWPGHSKEPGDAHPTQQRAEIPDRGTPSAGASRIPSAGPFKVAETLRPERCASKWKEAPPTWPAPTSWRGGAPSPCSSRGPRIVTRLPPQPGKPWLPRVSCKFGRGRPGSRGPKYPGRSQAFISRLYFPLVPQCRRGLRVKRCRGELPHFL